MIGVANRMNTIHSERLRQRARGQQDGVFWPEPVEFARRVDDLALVGRQRALNAADYERRLAIHVRVAQRQATKFHVVRGFGEIDAISPAL